MNKPEKRFLHLTGYPSADMDLSLSREINRQGQRNLSIIKTITTSVAIIIDFFSVQVIQRNKKVWKKILIQNFSVHIPISPQKSPTDTQTQVSLGEFVSQNIVNMIKTPYEVYDNAG